MILTKIPDVWMILTHEEVVTEWYFLYGSNGTGKNEFVSQFTCLQLHFYVKLKDGNIIIINNYCVSHKHISTRK